MKQGSKPQSLNDRQLDHHRLIQEHTARIHDLFEDEAEYLALMPLIGAWILIRLANAKLADDMQEAIKMALRPFEEALMPFTPFEEEKAYLYKRLFNELSPGMFARTDSAWGACALEHYR